MSRKILAAAALALSACAGSQQELKPAEPIAQAQQVREPSAEEYQYAGVLALKEDDLARAKEELGKAVAKDPKLVIANYDLGLISQSEGDLEAAGRYYRRVLEINGEHGPTILNLGRVYRDQQKYEEGIALYERALEKRPFDVNLLNNVTVFYRLAKKHEKATQSVRKLLSRTKDNPDAYKNLALVAYEQGQIDLAAFVSANALKLDEKDPGVQNNLGLVYMKQGERRLALRQFKKAVALDPSFSPALANIGALALSYRDYESAAANFEQVVKLDPTNVDAHLNLAWAYEGVRLKDGTHRTADAASEYEKVLAQVKNHPEALYGLARASAGELKDLARAKGYFERYIALSDGAAKQKAVQELQVVEQRIQAGAEADRLRREAEEKRQRAEEEKRRKAAQQQPSDSSILEQVSEKAAQQESGGTTPPDGQDLAPQPRAAPETAPNDAGNTQQPASGSEQVPPTQPAADVQPAQD